MVETKPAYQRPRIQPGTSLSFLKWKELERGLKKGGLIDDQVESQIARTAQKGKQILERITAAVQMLSQQNLAFRGHRESLDNNQNSGNFLELMKFLAKFDPFMKEHLDSVSEKPKSLSYLSPTVQNELISIMGAKVRQSIITRIKKAKYFSIIFDTTPDNSHMEQMSQIIRFVEVSRGSVKIEESFIDFIPVHGKKAEAITMEITKKLEQDGLVLQDCRGQSYDNQATMAGVHSGVQKRILGLNALAVLVPCNNHSLNLVCVHAAHVHSLAVTFFGTLERLFVYFSSSTYRWEDLKEFTNITLKSHSDTRWSSKAVAVTALYTQFSNVISALQQLRDSPSETINSHGDAGLILTGIQRFEFAAFLCFWSQVLPAVDRIQKSFQVKSLSFHQALIQLQTLIDKIEVWKNKLCDIAISEAEDKCSEWGISVHRRRKKKRSMPGESASDSGLSTPKETHRCLREILDKLGIETTDRFSELRELKNRFGFLCTTESLVNQTNQTDKQLVDLRKKCDDLASVYPNDLNGSELCEDYEDIISFLKRAKLSEEMDYSPQGLLIHTSHIINGIRGL